MESFETTNEVIVDWIETKLRDTCRCIGLFMNYLLIPRDGFKKHTYPTLSLPIVKYVIEEIFNCEGIIDKVGTVSFPEDFLVKTRGYLKEYAIADMNIKTEVIEYLWKYISVGVSSITDGIDVKKEIANRKAIERRKASKKRKEAIDKFKVESVKEDEFASDKIRAYKEVRNKIKASINSTEGYIKKYNEDKKFRTYSAVPTFDEYETDLLTELAVEPKRLVRIDEGKQFEDKYNKLMDTGAIDISKYANIMKQVLEHQLKTLKRILADINSSGIILLLKNTSEGLWEKEYVKISKNLNVKKFIAEVSKSIEKAYKDIDEEDIEKEVERKVLNKIKTRIAVSRTYISNKTCEKGSFDRDIDDCTLQSLTYLIVTLMDWLEIDYVTPVEIGYALRILLPQELVSLIDTEGGTSDDKFKMLLTKKLNKCGIRIKSEDYDKMDVITETMKKIDELDPSSEVYEKFNNRVRYFANSL